MATIWLYYTIIWLHFFLLLAHLDFNDFLEARSPALSLAVWCSVNALASHRCDPGSIPNVGMWDGDLVTKSDRWVSSGYSGFHLHEDHPNANIGANEHDQYKLYNLFRNVYYEGTCVDFERKNITIFYFACSYYKSFYD